jgi:hypothetical protein
VNRGTSMDVAGVRRIALALPEVEEDAHGDRPAPAGIIAELVEEAWARQAPRRLLRT